MSDFWYRQDMAARSHDERQRIATLSKQLRKRQIELKAIVDDLESQGGTDEEWEAYADAFAQWNNDVMDLAELARVPFSNVTGTANSPFISSAAHATFTTLMAALDEPIDGSHRTGKGGLSNL